MKFILCLIIFFFIGIFIYLGHLHIKYTPEKQDKALKRSPSTANISNMYKIQKKVDSKTLNFTNDVFLKDRGVKGTDVIEEVNIHKEDPRFELVGITRFGKIMGATIINKNPARKIITKSKMSPRAIRRSRKPTKQRAPAPRTKIKAKYYPLNQDVGGGYILSEVKSRSVVLIKGNDKVELTLDFTDSGSSLRIESVINKEKKESIKKEILDKPKNKEKHKINKEEDKKKIEKVKKIRKNLKMLTKRRGMYEQK